MADVKREGPTEFEAMLALLNIVLHGSPQQLRELDEAIAKKRGK